MNQLVQYNHLTYVVTPFGGPVALFALRAHCGADAPPRGPGVFPMYSCGTRTCRYLRCSDGQPHLRFASVQVRAQSKGHVPHVVTPMQENVTPPVKLLCVFPYF